MMGLRLILLFIQVGRGFQCRAVGQRERDGRYKLLLLVLLHVRSVDVPIAEERALKLVGVLARRLCALDKPGL